MKTIIKSMATLMCVLLAISLASCVNIDEKINEATAPLNERITSLNGQIAELNSEIGDLEDQIDSLEGKNETLEGNGLALETEKAALEKEKAALEKEKAALEKEKAALEAENAELEEKIDALEIEIVCASGRHFYDGESEVEYTWNVNLMTCSAGFTCSVCKERAVVSASNISTDEDGDRVATFEDGVPADTISVPFFTGVSFNSGSEAYDEATNTFRLTSGNPLVITFEGKNLDKISASDEHGLIIGTAQNMYLFDYVSNSRYDIVSVTDTTVTVTVDPDKISWNSDAYGYISRFAIYDLEPESVCIATLLDINVRFEGETYAPTTDAEGYTLVSNAEELKTALLNSKKIRFSADIESEKGFQVDNSVVIDLAGYDLTLASKTQQSFWIYRDCEILDSVGGSHLAVGITVNSGTLKFSDSITLSENECIGISANCYLDLSDYTGDELLIYVFETAGGVTLPEGYSLYDGNGVVETAIYHIYVRPTEQQTASE